MTDTGRQCCIGKVNCNCTRKGVVFCKKNEIIPDRDDLRVICLKLHPKGCIIINMSTIGDYIKEKRKEIGLTQEEFAMRSGLGLRFVRELEQGKETVRLDKVNQALGMFGKEAVPGDRKEL